MLLDCAHHWHRAPELVQFPLPSRAQCSTSVVTYPGGANGNETLYLDGAAINFQLKPLEIQLPANNNMVVGAWINAANQGSSIYGGEVGIGALRLHDHVLTPTQVLFNYNADFAWYHTSPTPTPSQTPSHTGTPTVTATSTASASLSAGASPSSTPSASVSTSLSSTMTPTATLSPRIATAVLLVDMQAVDFNAAAGTWDNRMTPGAVSLANGDFVVNASAPAYSHPVALTFAQAPAVYFNGTSVGNAQYMIANGTLPLYGNQLLGTGVYGNSDWTWETWIYHTGVYSPTAESTTAPQSPVFQWGMRNGTTCVSAHFGIGGSPSDGSFGHWGCDAPFAPGPNTYQPAIFGATAGFTPTINTWHH